MILLEAQMVTDFRCPVQGECSMAEEAEALALHRGAASRLPGSLLSNFRGH